MQITVGIMQTTVENYANKSGLMQTRVGNDAKKSN